METRTPQHIIHWFGIISGSPVEEVPRNRHMNGGDWGWDAKCSCGWESRTGGAIQERVREMIADHRLDAVLDLKALDDANHARDLRDEHFDNTRWDRG